MSKKKYIKSEDIVPFVQKVVNFSPSLRLDDDYNYSIYRMREKKEFKTTETAYFLVTPGKQANIAYDVLVGSTLTWQNVGSITKDVTDIIVFANERNKSLAQYPYGQVTAKWNPPNSVGFVIVNGTEIVTSEETMGVLECTYKVLSDRIGIRYNGSISDLVEVDVTTLYSNGSSASAEATFLVASKKDIELLVTDIETGNPIAGATVSISGSGVSGTLSQITDVEGKTIFCELEVGSKYNVIMTHPDYISSNTDYLNNDSFVVS